MGGVGMMPLLLSSGNVEAVELVVAVSSETVFRRMLMAEERAGDVKMVERRRRTR